MSSAMSLLRRDYLPDELVGSVYYAPGNQGEEQATSELLAARRAARGAVKSPSGDRKP